MERRAERTGEQVGELRDRCVCVRVSVHMHVHKHVEHVQEMIGMSEEARERMGGARLFAACLPAHGATNVNHPHV